MFSDLSLLDSLSIANLPQIHNVGSFLKCIPFLASNLLKFGAVTPKTLDFTTFGAVTRIESGVYGRLFVRNTSLSFDHDFQSLSRPFHLNSLKLSQSITLSSVNYHWQSKFMQSSPHFLVLHRCARHYSVNKALPSWYPRATVRSITSN